MKLLFGGGGGREFIFGFVLKKINFSFGKAIQTHAHKEFIIQWSSVTLRKSII